jgi:hypothetical protein
MSISDDERLDAEKTGALVRKKLREIMEMQADIDTLLRDQKRTPFGSEKWQYACPEALQRIVAMTAIQFILYEPVGWVKGNDEFKSVAETMIKTLIAQLKTLKTKQSDY